MSKASLKPINSQFDEFKFKKYMAKFPFNNKETLNLWLKTNELTYDQFLLWFERSNTSDNLMENCPWMDYLLNTYKPSKNAADKYHNKFGVFIDFMLEKATNDFKRQLCVLKQKNECIEPGLLLKIFVDELTTPLTNMVSPTLTLEINVARQSNKLKGETPNDRYDSFITILKDKSYVLDIFNEYPVLLNRLIKKVELTTKELIEVFSRLLSDYDDLC